MTPSRQAQLDMLDAYNLRKAAVAMKRWSKRPNSFWLGVFCGVLTKMADSIEAGQ